MVDIEFPALVDLAGVRGARYRFGLSADPICHVPVLLDFIFATGSDNRVGQDGVDPSGPIRDRGPDVRSSLRSIRSNTLLAILGLGFVLVSALWILGVHSVADIDGFLAMS